MADSEVTFAKLREYLGEIQRHTAGRRALHLRVSKLEKHLRESHYRRTIAALLRTLVDKHGAVMFPLFSTDIILVTRTASVEDIAAALSNVYKEFQKSAVLAGSVVVPGESDHFTTWYDLEKDYETLLSDVELLAAGGKLEGTARPIVSVGGGDNKSVGGGNTAPPKMKNRPGVRYVGIPTPKKETIDKKFDPDMLLAFSKALHSADVASFIKKQKVVAMVGDHGAPVMVHRTVPNDIIFGHLLRESRLQPNTWFNGYISDLVSERILKSEPNMNEEGSLASSLSVTVATVLSDAFDIFDASQGSMPKSKIVLEFSVQDLMANSDAFLAAKEKITDIGYRYCISGINLVSFGWVNKELLNANFVKVSYPPELPAGWLDQKRSLILRTRLKDIGIAKFILNECESAKMIDDGKALGFTMFQGSAVAG